MPVTVTELQDSREQNGVNVIFRYGVVGTSDTVEAITSTLATAPTAFAGLARHDEETRLRPTVVSDYFELEVPYRLIDTSVGSSSYQFETGGGSQKITQSLATNRYSPSGQTAPDFKGAIGVTKNGIEGVEITIPSATFSETHYLSVASVTSSYQALVESLTGKVATAAFKGRARGEVLFLGASGSQRGTEAWEVTFRFARSPNATGLTIGNITGINKLGWDYLWVYYDEEEDTAANRVVKRPVAVYVEQVYEFADLSQLGIGT